MGQVRLLEQIFTHSASSTNRPIYEVPETYMYKNEDQCVLPEIHTDIFYGSPVFLWVEDQSSKPKHVRIHLITTEAH